MRTRYEVCEFCGGQIIYEIQWWPEWGLWVTMPVCLNHGGPMDGHIEEIVK